MRHLVKDMSSNRREPDLRRSLTTVSLIWITIASINDQDHHPKHYLHQKYLQRNNLYKDHLLINCQYKMDLLKNEYHFKMKVQQFQYKINRMVRVTEFLEHWRRY